MVKVELSAAPTSVTECRLASVSMISMRAENDTGLSALNDTMIGSRSIVTPKIFPSGNVTSIGVGTCGGSRWLSSRWSYLREVG